MVPLLITTFLLEKKVYNEDASVEEIEAIKSRVYQLEENIILFHELPIMSDFTINLMFDELEKILEKEEGQSVLFDLAATVAPNFRTRQLLYKRFQPISPKANIFSFSTGKNGLMNVALKFFMNTTMAPVSNSIFSNSYQDALNKIYEKIGK